MIVMDTNVLSEIVRAAPAPQVFEWYDSLDAGDVFTTAVTVGELLYGVERLPAGRRRSQLAVVVHKIVHDALAGHVIPYDLDAAAEFAIVMADRERIGRSIDGPDAQIAAICRSRGAVLATRDTLDFETTGVDVLDPWETG